MNFFLIFYKRALNQLSSYKNVDLEALEEYVYAENAKKVYREDKSEKKRETEEAKIIHNYQSKQINTHELERADIRFNSISK